MNRRWLVVSVAVATVVVGLAGVAGALATSYDRRNAGRLLPGTMIEGIAVGGMTQGAAVRLLRDRIEAPLHRQFTVRSGTFEQVTTPWELGLRVDVRAAVRKARGETDGNVVTRVWRRLFTSPQRVVAARPSWNHAALDASLKTMGDRIRTAPVDAELDGSSGWVSIKPGKPGLELDAQSTRDSLTAAVELGDPAVPLVTKDVPPARGKDAFQEVILIRTGENKLYLYRNGSIAKEWPVATGSPNYATPTGTWQIIEKIVNPTWYNPGSAWASGMPARIGPGPNNPLGTHALALDAPAILIHGTPDRSSIGYNVSHGCIRMLAEHEIELFEHVEVGTPVVVVSAGTPQPRVEVPAATDPTAAAAVNF